MKGVHTKRTFVLILRNVTKHSVYLVDAEWDRVVTAASEEFLRIGNQADFPKESNKTGGLHRKGLRVVCPKADEPIAFRATVFSHRIKISSTCAFVEASGVC